MGVLAALVGTPSSLRAAPPSDDWGLEVDKKDALLVHQRFAKLKRNPFDKKQFRALERTLGRAGLASRIENALARSPNSVDLKILAARARLASGDAKGASKLLTELEAKAGKRAGRVFELRVEALSASRDIKAMVEALESRAAMTKDGPDQSRLLKRAYEAADRGSLHDRALALASKLRASEPNSVDAILRHARAARSAGKHDVADEAFEDAVSATPAKRRGALVAERARARIDAGDPKAASALLWKLLEARGVGHAHEREDWWGALEAAHRQDASSEQLARRVEKWLHSSGSNNEAAAWRTLARAQQVAGMDPVPAWTKAVAADRNDPIARAALIEALEGAGRYDDALAEYRRLAGKTPAEVQLGLDMATRLITNGERKTGLEVAEEIATRAGRNGNTLLLLLDFYNTNDEQDLALDTAQRLTRARPRDAESRVALGEQLWQMGRHGDARREWAMLPKLVRPSHKGWARHAEVLLEHANNNRSLQEEALRALSQALKGRPGEPRYLRLRAVVQEERGRLDLAYDTWELVRKHATGPEAMLLRTEARTRMVELLAGPMLPNKAKRRSLAEADAKKDLDNGPGDRALEAGLLLAELYTREERYAQAVSIYDRLVEMFPGEGDRLMDLAVAQRRAGQTELAMTTLRRVLEVDVSRKVEVLSLLSELSYETGDIGSARESAVAAAAESKDGRHALIRLGELHERHGDVERARGAYEAVLEKTPKDARARMRLAELELTTGDPKGAAKSFRAILEAGGPPDLMRQAGERALDLAEATGSTADLLDLAVKRTQKEPGADEPRDFLLDVVDRLSLAEVESWLRPAKSSKPAKSSRPPKRATARVQALRSPLVAALSRGPVGVRLRAAEHLGELALPDTAIYLARMGANLVPPRDSTNTVRRAFSRTRVGALRAAGSLDDPSAIPVLAGIIDSRHQDASTRHAALWALAQSEHSEATAPLRKQLGRSGDEIDVSLACLGLARKSRGAERVEDLVAAHAVAMRARSPEVRHACTFAVVALTPDHRVAARIHPQLELSDPVMAAIAAWRLGEIDVGGQQDGVAPQATVEALLTTYLGPAGLSRDAAASALVRLLGKRPAGIRNLPPFPEAQWKSTVERWLAGQLVPVPWMDPAGEGALTASDLVGHEEAVMGALERSLGGTRADARAAEATLRSCAPAQVGGAPPRRSADTQGATAVCLAPLVRGSITLPLRPEPPERKSPGADVPR